MSLSYIPNIRGERPLYIKILFSLFLTSILYWPGLIGPFFLDDLITLQKFNIETLSVTQLLQAAFAGEPGPLSRPLSMLTLALNDYFTVLHNPDFPTFGFKLINLMLHLITGFSLYYFTKLLLQLYNTQKILSDAFIAHTAWLTSLLFLIHPFQVSTVLYIIQRMTELSSLFMILGLLGYLWGRHRLINHKPHAHIIIFTALILGYSLAILSKENGALLGIYVLIIEFVLYKPRKPENRFILFVLILFSLIPLLTGMLYILLHWSNYAQTYANFGLTITERLLTQIHALYFYLQQIITPSLSHMSLYHDDFPVTRTLDIVTSIMLIGILSLLGFACYIRKTQPIIALGILWFFSSHLIESTILPLELVFEHRNYLALYGIMLCISYSLNKLYFYATQRYHSLTSSILTISIIFIFSSLTLARVHIWRDQNLFFELAHHDHPHSLRINIELANLLLLDNNYASAIHLLDQTQRDFPNNPSPSLQRLLADCKNEALPIAVFNQARDLLLTQPVPAYAISALDMLIQKRINQQCPNINPEQLFTLVDNTVKNPRLQKNTLWQSMLLQLRARAYLLTKNYNLATQDLQKAYNIYPKRLAPLIELIHYQIAYGDKIAASKTVLLLETLQKNITVDIESEIAIIKEQLHNPKLNAQELNQEKIKKTPAKKQNGIFEI